MSQHGNYWRKRVLQASQVIGPHNSTHNKRFDARLQSMPKGENMDEVLARVTPSNLSDAKRKIILRGLKAIKK